MKHNSLFFPVLAGVIFFAFNAYYSDNFYHINSFKMVYMGLFILVCFFIYDISYLGYNRFIQKNTLIECSFPWKEALLFLLPVLGTHPGFLLHLGENIHYNYRYELAIELIALLWMVYIIRFLRTDKMDKAIIIFLLFVGFSTLYVWFFGVLETQGLSPYLNSAEKFSGRIAVAYGNSNLIAGALAPMLPIFLLLSIPKIQRVAGTIHFQAYFSKTRHILFFLFFLASSHALLLTKTRAAIAAGILSCLIVLFILLVQIFFKKKIHILSLFLFVAICFAIFLFVCFFYRDQLSELSRFFKIFYFETWQGRFIAWGPAVKAFLAAPIFGYGLGTSYSLFFRHIAPDSRILWDERSYNHAHSEWLEYLAEGGIFGYICFFILWGYVFYNLIKYFFYTKTNILHQRIILGSAAGMLGFFMHGSFSIAQRMLVTNIPQYALLAIAFVLIAYYKKELPAENVFWFRLKKIASIYKIWLAKWKQLPSLVRNQLPVALIILLVFIVYATWAKTQYEFVKIIKTKDSILQTIKFEKLKNKRQDVYLLDTLTRRYLDRKAYKKALANIQQTKEVIPNYRINGFLEALSYYHLGDTERAYELLKGYLKLDNYHDGTLSLTHKLSYLYNDKDTFLLTLKYIFEAQTAQRKPGKLVSYWNFAVNKSQTKNVVFQEVKTEDNHSLLRVDFSEKYFNQVYNAINAYVRNKFFGKPNFNLQPIIQSLSFEILKAAIEVAYIDLTPLSDDFETKNRVQVIKRKILNRDLFGRFGVSAWEWKGFVRIMRMSDFTYKMDNIFEGFESFIKILK